MLQNAALLDNASRIEALDWKMIDIEGEFSARRLEGRRLYCSPQGFFVADVATNRLDGAVEQHDRVVHKGRIEHGIAAIFFSELGNVLFVFRIFQLGEPRCRYIDSDGDVAERRKAMLVGQPAAAEQRDLVFHSGARELLDESDPASPGQEYIDGIGIGGAYGGKLGRIIH